MHEIFAVVTEDVQGSVCIFDEELLVEVERGRVASEDVADLVGHKEFPGNRPSNE